jgi:hypothetical protein
LGGFVLFAAAALATCIAPADSRGAIVRRIGRLTAALVILFFLAIVLNVPLVGLLQRLVLAAVCAWIATVTTTMACPQRQSNLPAALA